MFSSARLGGCCHINRLIKFIFIIIGFIALGFGVIGIILPVVPTTPLLLLASFCFMKGSDRFSEWFKGTKLYQKHLESFVKKKSMTLRQKVTILLFADIMIAIPLFTMDHLYIKFLLVLVIVYKYYYFVFKIKTIPPNDVSLLSAHKNKAP